MIKLDYQMIYAIDTAISRKQNVVFYCYSVNQALADCIIDLIDYCITNNVRITTLSENLGST
jgi:hypothetical protein